MVSIIPLFEEKLKSNGDEIVFDGYVSSKTNLTNNITRSPLQDGFYTNDAINTNEITANIIIYIDNALKLPGGIGVSGVAGSESLIDLFDRATPSVEKLFKWWKNKQLIDIKTKFFSFKNAGILSISIPETRKKGVTINLEIVELQNYSIFGISKKKTLAGALKGLK